MRLLAHHNCGDRAESLFLCGEARKRGFFYGSGFDREQLVVGAGAVYGGAGLHHQGRRFLCGRRSLDGRSLRNPQVYHRLHGGELCNHPAGDAGFRLCGAGGQCGYRRGQRRRVGYGQYGIDSLSFAGLYDLRDAAQTVRDEGMSLACGGAGAVRLYPRQQAFCAGERADPADLCRVSYREPALRAA